MSKDVEVFEKEVQRMMAAYRDRHKKDPVTDEKLREDIVKFLNERNK